MDRANKYNQRTILIPEKGTEDEYLSVLESIMHNKQVRDNIAARSFSIGFKLPAISEGSEDTIHRISRLLREDESTKLLISDCDSINGRTEVFVNGKDLALRLLKETCSCGMADIGWDVLDEMVDWIGNCENLFIHDPYGIEELTRRKKYDRDPPGIRIIKRLDESSIMGKVTYIWKKNENKPICEKKAQELWNKRTENINNIRKELKIYRKPRNLPKSKGLSHARWICTDNIGCWVDVGFFTNKKEGLIAWPVSMETLTKMQGFCADINAWAK